MWFVLIVAEYNRFCDRFLFALWADSGLSTKCVGRGEILSRALGVLGSLNWNKSIMCMQ